MPEPTARSIAAALAKIVFAPPPDGPRELKYLEQLTHPRIGQQIARAGQASCPQQGTAAAIVLDVPLLFESGWNKFCDKIVFVDAPRDAAARTSRGARLDRRRILPVVRPPRNRWKPNASWPMW